MRFGRILLAGLTALAAYSYAQTTPAVRDHDAFPRLFQAVVPLFTAVADSSIHVPVARPPAQAALALDALSSTPLCGSLILLASFLAVDLRPRRHQRALLRC